MRIHHLPKSHPSLGGGEVTSRNRVSRQTIAKGTPFVNGWGRVGQRGQGTSSAGFISKASLQLVPAGSLQRLDLEVSLVLGLSPSRRRRGLVTPAIPLDPYGHRPAIDRVPRSTNHRRATYTCCWSWRLIKSNGCNSQSEKIIKQSPGESRDLITDFKKTYSRAVMLETSSFVGDQWWYSD